MRIKDYFDQLISQKKWLKKSWINKFSVSAIVFFVWITFLDSHSVIDSISLKRSIHRLEEERELYKEQIKQALLDREDLKKNKEKYGREKYYMHKENEDVFIIERSNKE